MMSPAQIFTGGLACLNHESDLTVIIPAAGSGKRLGLNYPKELYEIIPGKKLVDYTLDHIQAAAGAGDIKIRIAVVIMPWKHAVVDYVRDRMNGVDVVPVIFDDRFEEWPGSVYSASSVFSACNLVLLPDSYLEVSEEFPFQTGRGKPLLKEAHQALKTSAAVFGVVPCAGDSGLQDLGAVHVNTEGKISDFQDKPRTDFHRFNGFWGCYGFQRDWARSLYEYLIQSVHHQAPPIQSQPFHPVSVIRLFRYCDLGTWNAVNRFQTGIHRVFLEKKD